jgi:hypothetical protein
MNGWLTAWLGIITFMLLASVLGMESRMRSVERRLDFLWRLDGKLDALLRHAGVEFDPLGKVAPDVVDALKKGNRNEAIKRYQAVTGVGRGEAIDYVNEVQRWVRRGA